MHQRLVVYDEHQRAGCLAVVHEGLFEWGVQRKT
jgi:hypothetical protein